MSLLKHNDKLYTYRYTIDEFKIVNGPSTISLGPLNILNLTIEHNYMTYVFPVFRVRLSLNPETYDYLIKNRDQIKFKLRMTKHSIEKTSGKKSMYTDVINSTFTTYIDADMSGVNLDAYKKRKKTENIKSEDDMFGNNNPIEIFLFNDNYVSKLKASQNFVLASADITTGIAYLLSKEGVSNVLISPLDNKRVYSPFIFPEMDAIKGLSYLDQNFGLYKNGSLIYFGLSRGYILNYCGECTAYEDNEIQKTNILISKMVGSGDIYEGAVKRSNDDNYYIAMNEINVTVSNATQSENIISGINSKVVNVNTSDIQNSNANISTRTATNNSTIINNTDNPYVASTITAQKKALQSVITMSVNDINIDAFEPNKELSVIFEDINKNDKYKGRYKISNVGFIFTSGPEFTVNATATIQRI